jgi:uncharacterized protein
MSVPPRRPLVLLPPSKGKSPGGDGPPYATSLAGDRPLDEARRTVLRAIAADLGAMDDAEVARLAGVGLAAAPTQRTALAGLAQAPTVPAHLRYTGVVHGNAGLGEVRPRTAAVDVRIVSGLLGLVALHEPVPDYRVEVAASIPSLGGLGPYWRRALAGHLAAVGRGRRVWDLLPAEHRRALDPEVLASLDRTEVRFLRHDGRAANAARTKVAKGRFVAALLADATLAPADVGTVLDLGDGWEVAADDGRVTAISRH